MTDWVPGDWETASRNIRVQLRRPDGLIEGNLLHSDRESALIGFASGEEQGIHSSRFYERDGWNLFVPVPPQPELPTEAGAYSAPTGAQSELGAWHTDSVEIHYLNADGNWCDMGWGQPTSGIVLTRLVPEAETAKKFVAVVEAKVAKNPLGGVAVLGFVREVATEFGVSLD